MEKNSKYAYFRCLNELILKKEKEEEIELTFYDYYLFHATSMALSFIREGACLNNISYCGVFTLRSIIEDLAVLKMYANGEIGSECKDLLRGYQYLCEYKMYKKFSILNEGFFNLEEMKQNYKDVKDYYKEMIELNSSQFEALLACNNLPFLKEKYNFHVLIEKYCPDYLKDYEQMSYIVHPSFYHNNKDLPMSFDFTKYLEDVYNESIKYYPVLKVEERHELRYEIKNYFSEDLFKIISMSKFYDYFDSVLKNDLKIIDGNYKNKFFFIGNLIKDEIASIIVDYFFGFSEVLKSKIKPLFEMFSVIDFSLDCLNNKDYIKFLDVFEIYDYMHINKNFNDKSIEEKIKEFNEEYKKEIFTEHFKGNINKSMPEFFGFNSITDFVFSMIKDYFKDNEEKQIECVKLVYAESQHLSHGNGYMLMSNEGCFSDYTTALAYVDAIINGLINKVKDILNKNAKDDSSFRKASYDMNKKIIKKYVISYKYKALTFKEMEENKQNIG